MSTDLYRKRFCAFLIADAFMRIFNVLSGSDYAEWLDKRDYKFECPDKGCRECPWDIVATNGKLGYWANRNY